MFLLVVIVSGMFLLTAGSAFIAMASTFFMVKPLFGARAHNWSLDRLEVVGLTLFAIYSLLFFLLYGHLLRENNPW